jgi:xanthine dehydrogenase iron-sulfur cluster and FAD-binding subunit A
MLVSHDRRFVDLKNTIRLIPTLELMISLVDGKHVITIEGLGTLENPHPLQERIAKLHGSQYASSLECSSAFTDNWADAAFARLA